MKKFRKKSFYFLPYSACEFIVLAAEVVIVPAVLIKLSSALTSLCVLLAYRLIERFLLHKWL